MTGNEADVPHEVTAEQLTEAVVKTRGKPKLLRSTDGLWTTMSGRPSARGLRLLAGVRDTKLTRHRVASVLRRLSSQERLLVNRHITWWTPHARNGDPEYYITKVSDMLHRNGYLESRWPLYMVMLRENISNAEWLSYAAIMIAVWDTLQEVADEYIASRKREL